jgi:AcrR family transcriptional regulator
MTKIGKENETRKLIRDTAVDLFSQKGYDAVSIREIARKVGINESSIYNHYCGKEDIMDSIIKSLIAEFNAGPGEVPMEALLEKYGPERYVNFASQAMIERLREPQIGKIMRLFCIELYRNEKIGDFFRNTYIEPSYQMWEQIFRRMMDLGYIKEYDTLQLAHEFFDYNIFLIFDCFVIHYDEKACDRSVDNMIGSLSRHVKFVFDAVWLPEAGK